VLALGNNGGYFMNQRYLIEAVAFGFVVTPALLWPWLAELRRFGPWAVGGALVAMLLGLRALRLPMETLQPVSQGLALLLDRAVPVLLALGLAGLGVAWMAGKRSDALRAALACLLAAAAVLPIFNHAAFDRRLVRDYRASRRALAADLDAVVPEGSLLIVYGGQREPAARLKETRDIWVADALRSEWAGVPELARDVLKLGDRKFVYLFPDALPKPVLEELAQSFTLREVRLGARRRLAELVPLARSGPTP